jgi:Flp pilus assembly protein TadD
LKRATEQDLQNVTLRMTLAQSCMRSEQYQCVLDMHKEILALNAESAEADMLAGEALDHLGHSAEATKEFRSAIAKNPKEPNAHFGLGYLLWTQGKWAEAVSEFQLELQNDPRHARARIYLADSLVREAEYAQAQAELGKLSADEQSAALVHRDLGIIHAYGNRNADAVREFEMAVMLDPGEEETHLELARIYASMGKRDDASAERAKASRAAARRHEPLEQVIGDAEAP